jgi:uncharacterized protein (TIGR03085 family)
MDWNPVERRALTQALESTGPGVPTLCEGGNTEHIAAHVVLRETAPVVAAGVAVPALHDRTERITRELGDRSVETDAWPELLHRVRQGPPWWQPVQWAGDAAQLLELHVQTEDARRGTGGAGVPSRDLIRSHEDALWREFVRTSRMLYGRAGVRVTLVGERTGQRHVVGDGAEVTVRGGMSELILHGFGRGRAARVTVDGDPDAVATLDRNHPR